MSPAPDLAVCCAYFNFNGYRSRLANYLRFRERIEATGVRLLTVQLLADVDAPRLPDSCFSDIYTVYGDALWQKERLLQAGAEILVEAGYEKILLLDADVEYESPNWPAEISAALNDHLLLQGFARITHVFADRVMRQQAALAQRRNKPARGGAIGVRAELIDTRKGGPGLYQHCIVGGGDQALIEAIVKRHDPPPGSDASGGAASGGGGMMDLKTRLLGDRQFPNAAYLDHYRAWAARFHAALDQRWGFVNLDLRTMPHGCFTDRGYARRYELLRDFDPMRDVLIVDDAFRWYWGKPELERGVRDYFASRDEDAATAGMQQRSSTI